MKTKFKKSITKKVDILKTRPQIPAQELKNTNKKNRTDSKRIDVVLAIQASISMNGYYDKEAYIDTIKTEPFHGLVKQNIEILEGILASADIAILMTIQLMDSVKGLNASQLIMIKRAYSELYRSQIIKGIERVIDEAINLNVEIDDLEYAIANATIDRSFKDANQSLDSIIAKYKK